MNLSKLTAPGSSGFHTVSAPAPEVRDKLLAVTAPGVAVRVIRGTKATTVHDLYNEAAAALQFPVYFGENWDAFRDCLCDLRWLHAKTVVLGIVDAEHLLAHAPKDDFKKLTAILGDAVKLAKGHALHVVIQSANLATENTRWASVKPTGLT